MTWLEFTTSVKARLPEESRRQGQGVQTALDKVILAAAMELQRKCKRYQKEHETVYGWQDFAMEGYASKGVLPPTARVKQVHLIRPKADGSADRHPCGMYSWDRRFELSNGMVPVSQVGLYAVSPDHYHFYVYPRVTREWLCSVFWDGVKDDFVDTDITSFDEAAAEAAHWRVKGDSALKIEMDPATQQRAMEMWLRDIRTIRAEDAK